MTVIEKHKVNPIRKIIHTLVRRLVLKTDLTEDPGAFTGRLHTFYSWRYTADLCGDPDCDMADAFMAGYRYCLREHEGLWEPHQHYSDPKRDEEIRRRLEVADDIVNHL